MRWLVCLGVILAGCGAVKAPRNTSPLKAITTIHTAEVQYYSAYGRFAASPQELGPPGSGSDTGSAAGLIERDLASGDKGGYKFTLTPTPAGFAISAAPDQYGTTGNKTYFSDQGMGIHVHNGLKPATVTDPSQGKTGAPTTASPNTGELGPSAAALIERDLASGEKGGYKFTIRPLPQGYTISAVPVSSGTDSTSYLFGSDSRTHVHHGPGTATEDDPIDGETPPSQ